MTDAAAPTRLQVLTLPGIGWLLASLLLLQLLEPLPGTLDRSLRQIVFVMAFLVVLCTSAFVLGNGHRRRALAIVLALPVIAAAVFAIGNTDNGRISLLVAPAAVPLFALVLAVVMRFVLAGTDVAMDRLLGTAAGFLLLAHLWSGLYAAVELAMPGAFQTPEGAIQSGETLYFSMVTQTTLGYGEIAPASGFARSLATLQATSGLFYMAVIVARYAGNLDLDHSKHGASEA